MLWRLLFTLVVFVGLVSDTAYADYWVEYADTLEVGTDFVGYDARLVNAAASGADTTNQGSAIILNIGGQSASNYGRAWIKAVLSASQIPDVLDSSRIWFYSNTAGTAALQTDTLYYAFVTRNVEEGTGNGTVGSWADTTAYRMQGVTWRSYNARATVNDSLWAKAGCDSPFVTDAPSGQPLYLQTIEQMATQGLVRYNSTSNDRSPWFRLGSYSSGNGITRSFWFTEAFRWLYYDTRALNYGVLIRDGREGENGRLVPVGTVETPDLEPGQKWGFYIYGKKRVPRWDGAGSEAP